MAAGHSHDHTQLARVPVATRARIVLLGSLAAVALATLAGLFLLWPDQHAVDKAASTVQFAAPGVTFPRAEITKVLPPCDPGSVGGALEPGASPCGLVDAKVTTGDAAGDKVSVQILGPVATAGLRAGDSIELMKVPQPKGSPALYSYFGVDRTHSLSLLAGGFVLVVLLVARLRGLLALVGLVFSGYVLVAFMLPALLSGSSGLEVALVGASAIMFALLYLAHGPSLRTSAALAGTIAGIAITAFVANYAVGSNRLSGVGDESGAFLSSLVGSLNFGGLLTCAIIVAGLGVLNDVTITQASSVWELRAAGPDLTRRQLFTSAMRIGRDHIASTIYTIVFAYTGAALSVVLIIFLYDRPLLDLLGTEDIATEVVRTLCSAIGLVLAVPITTAIATGTVAAATEPGEPVASPHRRHRR